jgi:mono/diheme cytochrome c family protein
VRRGQTALGIAVAGLLLAGGGLAALLRPTPVPGDAPPAQRAYLRHCAECHGPDGRGSLRARLLMIDPGNLADPRTLGAAKDEYLFTVIKEGGASVGMPGMPAFGFHLSDEEIRTLIGYLRSLAKG